MSVIVGRALPDVRDGLKPVHRKILYGMYDWGFRPDRNYVKCGRVVGDVMGNYHPHGDSSIYDTLVRMAQPWSLRYPLIDRRATSARRATTRPPPCATPSAGWPTWPWRCCATSTRRPSTSSRTTRATPRSRSILPARIPNLLVNGVGGHRGRHGHQHPAAQPARGRGRRRLGAGAPRRHRRGAARGAHRADPGPGLPDPRPDRRPRRHRGRLPHRSRLDPDARRRRGRGGPQGPHHPRRHRAALPGQPRQPRRVDRRRWPRRARSPASPTSTTSPPTASACASSSRSSATRSPRSC